MFYAQSENLCRVWRRVGCVCPIGRRQHNHRTTIPRRGAARSSWILI